MQHIQLPVTEQNVLTAFINESEKLSSMVAYLSNGIDMQFIESLKSAFTEGFHAVMWLMFGISCCIIIFNKDRT